MADERAMDQQNAITEPPAVSAGFPRTTWSWFSNGWSKWANILVALALVIFVLVLAFDVFHESSMVDCVAPMPVGKKASQPLSYLHITVADIAAEWIKDGKRNDRGLCGDNVAKHDADENPGKKYAFWYYAAMIGNLISIFVALWFLRQHCESKEHLFWTTLLLGAALVLSGAYLFGLVLRKEVLLINVILSFIYVISDGFGMYYGKRGVAKPRSPDCTGEDADNVQPSGKRHRPISNYDDYTLFLLAVDLPMFISATAFFGVFEAQEIAALDTFSLGVAAATLIIGTVMFAGTLGYIGLRDLSN